MTTNTSISLVGLNFDEIRLNLRNYIASKAEFADYDFNDSAIGTLLDLLAYNTYYNAFYTNMAASEAFIDSAQFYDSVVSRAKLIGYTPVSARGATANINVRFTSAVANSTWTSITVAKNTNFRAVINGSSYAFVTPQSYTITANSSNVFRGNMDIIEGYALTHRFLYSSTNTAFVLPNANVDTRSVSVTVTSSGNTQTYLQADDILTVNSSSKIFYLEGDRDYKYKIGFGDNVLGRRPDYSSTVAVSYRVCNATRGNGANNFSAVGTLGGQANFSITCNSRATGGADQENIESIRFNAPKIYETQNRAVTASDYQRIILRENRDLQAVSVWGGEENDPPIYGKVFAAVKPYSGTLISSARKAQIRTNVRKYNVQAIDLEFTDPTFLYICPDIRVHYDSTATSSTAAQIAAAVAARIIVFETNNFNRFGRSFYSSRFLNYLDGSDAGIVGSSAIIDIQKRFIPSLVTSNSYTLKFNSAMIQLGDQLSSSSTGDSTGYGYIRSTGFTSSGESSFLDDNAFGDMRIYYEDSPNVDGRIYTNTSAGTIDYEEGTVILSNFLPSAFVGDSIKIFSRPNSPNIIPIRNQILLFSDVRITVIEAQSGTIGAVIDTVSTLGSSTTETSSTNIASSY